MKTRYLEIFTLMIYVSTIIIIYSHIRCNYKYLKDPLSTFPLGGKDSSFSEILDGWSLSHFLFFLILGYFYKEYIFFIVLMGILWESFEYVTSNSGINIYILSWFRGLSKCNALSEENKNGHWMYAKVSDIFVNVLGLYVGYVLSKIKTINDIVKKYKINCFNLEIAISIMFGISVYLYNLNVM